MNFKYLQQDKGHNQIALLLYYVIALNKNLRQTDGKKKFQNINYYPVIMLADFRFC